MAAQWIDVALQVWDPRCKTAAQIAKALGAKPTDAVLQVREQHGPRCSTLVAFARVQLPEHGRGPERYDRFADALSARLRLAAGWLDQRSPEVFEGIRKHHQITRILITSLITQDQLDLDLPSEFIRACGKVGLSISLLTNE
jgi:hypothetical protein